MPRKKNTGSRKTNANRKRCATDGCRKLSIPGDIVCKACAEIQVGIDVVEKVTEVEALRFAKLDTEARNDNQAMEILTFKMAAVRQRAEQELGNLQMQKHQLQAAIDARKPLYQSMVEELAEKYGIDDPSQMTIDPETGVVRDLSKT